MTLMIFANLEVWSYVAIAAALLLAVIVFVYGLRPNIRVARLPIPQDDDEPEPQTDLPPVSVIVYYSGTDSDQLKSVLAQIYSQQYPDFEVIAVCDATSDAAARLAEELEPLYEHLHITFIPPGSHNLSRRKLALTIGIKAAHNEVILSTVANVNILSPYWIRLMAEPFADRDIDLALGITRPDTECMRGPWRWYREFDDQLVTTRWVGYALAHRPYRGDGYNLAMRRSVFMANKGFASTIHLHSGDDDLFVNQIATESNTVAVADRRAMLRTIWNNSANRVWALRKSKYDFTARWLPKGPALRDGFVSLCQWLIPALCVFAALVALPSWWQAVVAGVISTTFFVAEIILYRAVATRLLDTRLWWAVVPFRLARPLVNACFRLNQRSSNFKNYTWQRKR